ncbi:MAG: TIGR02996 domain-containing protein [Fimbriiglobus sp.]
MRRISLDEAALLRTICEDPDADLPRLVYADWLEEHDRIERAEFIRWQIEITNDPIRYGSSYFRNQFNTDFYSHFVPDWLKSLPRWAKEYDPSSHLYPQLFERGFLTKWEFQASLFARHGESFMAVHPLRILTLSQAKNLCPELGQSRAMRHIQRLDLRANNIDDWDLSRLLKNENLDSLETLNLRFNELSDASARFLATNHTLPRLQTLDLRCNQLILRSVERLAQSHFLSQVKTFLLSDNPQLERQPNQVYRLLGQRCDFDPS